MQSTTNTTDSAGGAQGTSSWSLELFHDGACPLCSREVATLRRLDREGRIKFTDIASEDFDPSVHGKDMQTLMAEIHARLPDGTWLRGVEVFRRLYAAVGFECLVTISRLPIVSQLLGLGYRIFSRSRLRLTGRCSSENGACRTIPPRERR